MRFRLNQNGNMDPLLIPLVLAVVFLVGISGFGIWAYTGYMDASKVEQEEIDEAVAAAEQVLTEDLEVAFKEREKKPTRTYTSPAQSGSVKIVYPKTWSVYSEEDTENGEVHAYLNPSYVRDVNDDAPVAMKMTIENKTYSDVVEQINKDVSKGEATARAVSKEGQEGVRVDGKVFDDFEGHMVIFPLRDKTLKIWTENVEFASDFNDIMYANLTFKP